MSGASPSRLVKRYRRVLEVSRHLAAALDLDSLLRNILNAAVELAGAEGAALPLYDRHSRRLYVEAAAGPGSMPAGQKPVVPEASIAGRVASSRTPQIINSLPEDGRLFTIDQEINLPVRSLIAVPLVARQKLVGVLEVLNKKEGGFNREDQEILLALADQAAAAIENARLLQQPDRIAGFVHALRTPMSSLFAASYLLQRPELAAEQRVKLAQTIQQETQRLNELASTFLDLTSLESGRAALRLARFVLQPLLEECLQAARLIAAGQNIQLHLEAPETLPELEADRDKLKQVLAKLLDNAVKYNCPQGQVWLRAWAEGGQMFLSVQDTGVGILPEQIPQLFTRFFRTSSVERSGAGLGLPLCRAIVEMHGGEILVESALNAGTTFTVQLPLAQGQE
jgi:signal transduction histidine kinase